MVIYKWEKKAHEIHLTHMQAITLNQETVSYAATKKSGTPFSGPGDQV